MRLMTYNLYTGGRCVSGPQRLEALRAVIDEAHPDVLALQECNGFEADGGRSLFWLERQLAMRGVLARASSGFHVALFFREATLLQAHALDEEMHHALLACRVELRGAPMTFLSAHLCPFSGEARLHECAQLLRFVRDDQPCFVLGDLNSLSPLDPPPPLERWPARRRARHLRADTGQLDTRALSYLARCGLVDLAAAGGGVPAATCQTPLRAGHADYQVRIDYILANAVAASGPASCRRWESEAAQSASDHYPLVADLEG